MQLKFYSREKNVILDVFTWYGGEFPVVRCWYNGMLAQNFDVDLPGKKKDGILLPVITGLEIEGEPVTVGDVFYGAESILEYDIDNVLECGGLPKEYCFVSPEETPSYYEIHEVKTGYRHDAEYYHAQVIGIDMAARLKLDGDGNVVNMFTHRDGVSNDLFRIMGVEV